MEVAFALGVRNALTLMSGIANACLEKRGLALCLALSI